MYIFWRKWTVEVAGILAGHHPHDLTGSPRPGHPGQETPAESGFLGTDGLAMPWARAQSTGTFHFSPSSAPPVLCWWVAPTYA